MPESFSLMQLPVATLVVAIAYLIRGVAGFGSGLIAIPLLALILPLSVVVPVIALLDLLASVSHGFGNRRDIGWLEIFTLLPFSLLGIGIAIYLFKTVDPDLLSTGLALFIILYSLYNLVSENMPTDFSRLWAMPWGAAGGMINALFGTGGPFYVIYLKLRGLGKDELRATIATILLFDGIGRVAGYAMGDFFNETALILVAAGLPLAALALFVGGHIQTGMSQKAFQRAISALLLVSGIALLIK
ncbi:sulfite exporter TauE/SafE family protein [Sedimenticola thiotaurini]|nr:sulfite exporter TauE/SafE family protein [Sedimenticola thiotaurini]